MIESLLFEIVDYAGLFPPAGLGMDEAVKNYSEYLRSDDRWMLGRFVVTSARLDELAEAAKSENDPEHSWRLSVLVPSPSPKHEDFREAVRKIDEFNRTHASIQIDSIECRLDDPGSATKVIDAASGFQMFWEVPVDSQLESRMDWIARHKNFGKGHAAKIRTGSVDASQIPTIEQVSRFIVACANRSVAFKATAGLHHPIRGEYPLTYEKNAMCATMFGFLNVFLGAMLAYSHRWNEEQLSVVLGSMSHSSIVMNDFGVGWDKWMIGWATVENLRKTFARSFGSCSFREPVEDLEALGIINNKIV